MARLSCGHETNWILAAPHAPTRTQLKLGDLGDAMPSMWAIIDDNQSEIIAYVDTEENAKLIVMALALTERTA